MRQSDCHFPIIAVDSRKMGDTARMISLIQMAFYTVHTHINNSVATWSFCVLQYYFNVASFSCFEMRKCPEILTMRSKIKGALISSPLV
jgi:hypothetical protein